MIDPAEALGYPTTSQTERGQLQRGCLVFSADCSRQAKEALTNATELLAEDIPGRQPDTELANASAVVAQGWGTLSHAEATRSVAAAAFAIDQSGINTFPSP